MTTVPGWPETEGGIVEVRVTEPVYALVTVVKLAAAGVDTAVGSRMTMNPAVLVPVGGMVEVEVNVPS